MPAERPFKDASCAGLLADMADARDGLQRLHLTFIVGDKLASAAEECAMDDVHDTELADNALDLAHLWRYLRGTAHG